jgi:hypothetical protein
MLLQLQDAADRQKTTETGLRDEILRVMAKRFTIKAFWPYVKCRRDQNDGETLASYTEIVRQFLAAARLRPTIMNRARHSLCKLEEARTEWRRRKACEKSDRQLRPV